jgi:hypothetical protein
MERIANGTAVLKDKSILEAQVGQIESRLKGLADVENQIGMAVQRLINPRPTAAGETGKAPQPSPDTIEGRLQNIVRTLDEIINDLSDRANTLNQAI